MFGQVVSEICVQTNTQTDRLADRLIAIIRPHTGWSNNRDDCFVLWVATAGVEDVVVGNKRCIDEPDVVAEQTRRQNQDHGRPAPDQSVVRRLQVVRISETSRRFRDGRRTEETEEPAVQSVLASGHLLLRQRDQSSRVQGQLGHGHLRQGCFVFCG